MKHLEAANCQGEFSGIVLQTCGHIPKQIALLKESEQVNRQSKALNSKVSISENSRSAERRRRFLIKLDFILLLRTSKVSFFSSYNLVL